MTLGRHTTISVVQTFSGDHFRRDVQHSVELVEPVGRIPRRPAAAADAFVGPTEPWEVTGVMSGAAHTDPPVIEVSHVSTGSVRRSCMRDVSLTVLRGEVFAIAGGNGCGSRRSCGRSSAC